MHSIKIDDDGRILVDDVTGGSFYEQQADDEAAVRHADNLINLKK